MPYTGGAFTAGRGRASFWVLLRLTLCPHQTIHKLSNPLSWGYGRTIYKFSGPLSWGYGRTIYKFSNPLSWGYELTIHA